MGIFRTPLGDMPRNTFSMGGKYAPVSEKTEFSRFLEKMGQNHRYCCRRFIPFFGYYYCAESPVNYRVSILFPRMCPMKPQKFMAVTVLCWRSCIRKKTVK